MKHCHISIFTNELIFLKRKLPFMYKHFDQIILVDYNILTKKCSTDGSVKYIESFNDPENKIIYIKDIDMNKIINYKGASFVEKKKMFAKASEYVKDDIDIVWATDLDEFFDESLIKYVEDMYNKDATLSSINIPHKIFVYNEHNIFNNLNFYISPRIVRHVPKRLYGHCNFGEYGKNIDIKDHYLYHFAFVGLKRCEFKIKIYKNNGIKFIAEYKNALNKKLKYINVNHLNLKLNLKSIPYTGEHLDYLDVEQMCLELNNEV
jgi:ribosomal protein S24E